MAIVRENKTVGVGGTEHYRKHTDVILDLSFWNREMRDEHGELAKEHGGDRYEILLVVCKASEEVLVERIQKRKRGHERCVREGRGYEGLSVNWKMLGRWMEGFEWPGMGEGPVVEIEVLEDGESERLIPCKDC